MNYGKCPLRVLGMDSPVILTMLKADIKGKNSHIFQLHVNQIYVSLSILAGGRVDLSLCSISCISVLHTDLSRVINV